MPIKNWSLAVELCQNCKFFDILANSYFGVAFCVSVIEWRFYFK